MNSLQKILILPFLFYSIYGNEISTNTFAKVISMENADNTYLTNMVRAIDGGFILCGYIENYDISSLVIEKNYEEKIRSLLEKLNNETKEEFTDCNAPQSICEGDDEWYSSMGNGEWDSGEKYVDANKNGKYDGSTLTDEERSMIANHFYGSGSSRVNKAREVHKRAAYLRKVDASGNEIWTKEYDFLNGYPYVKAGLENYLISFNRMKGPRNNQIGMPVAENHLITDIDGNVIYSNYK